MRRRILWLVLASAIVLAGLGCPATPPPATDETAVEALQESDSADEIVVKVLREPTVEYKYAQSFHEGFAAVGRNAVIDGYYIGYVDKNLNVVIPMEHFYIYWAFQDGGSASNFSEGLVAVSISDENYDWQERKWGFKDKTGKLVIPFEYDSAQDFSEGLATVERDGKRGFIDKAGNVVIPFDYDHARSFSEGLAAVRRDGKWGFIDKSGRIVVSFNYDDDGSNYLSAYTFSEGLAAVNKKDNGWGYIDKTGKVVIPFKYSAVGAFSEGMACVSYDDYNGKFGVINTDGSTVVPPIYDNEAYYDFHGSFFSLPHFSEGLLSVANVRRRPEGSDYMTGYIDKAGKIIIPLEYSYGAAFSEGLAAVRRGDKSGYIDKTGKTVVPFEYTDALSFSEGLAWVQKNYDWGILAINTD